MPQRHSKNNNDLAFFTYDEKRKLGYGTQRERLGKDSIKPFDTCGLCLKPFIDPMCCQKGHAFCKECILECLLAQKKDMQRRQAALATQKKHEKEEEEERLALQKARELVEFDQQNHGAVPQYTDKNNYGKDKNGFHGANSVKATSFEEEALRTMKAFWLPSATPEAPVKVEAPSTSTVCPEGNEKLKLKSLFPIYLTEDRNETKKSNWVDKTYICPSCKVTLTNTLSLVALNTCGHVFCKTCAGKFLPADKSCLVCSKSCKERNLVPLEKGGTGFAGHDEKLEAKDFKHLGSGSGLGLVRPPTKT
uniref:RING-type domain-containing protein n=1 Tax=Kalanchoe fedtschenkoi TaxID=63787 RepID=A0A7N0SWQ2_KALFE